MDSIIYNSNLSPMSRIVHIEILNLSKKTGYCYATNAHLAERFSTSQRTISRSISELTKAGSIKMIATRKGKKITERKLYPTNLVEKGIDKNGEGNITPRYTIRAHEGGVPGGDSERPLDGFSCTWTGGDIAYADGYDSAQAWACDAPPADGVDFDLEIEADDEIDPWDHTERFLKRFSGIKTFQTFADRRDGAYDRSLSKILHGDYAVDDLYCLNARGAGVFMAINETDGTGRTAANVKRVRAVFADLDGAPLEPALEYKPHMVVESSPGKYHAYWLCKDSDVPLDAFKQLQESIATAVNGDPVVKDLPRVMRVPGFLHQKGDKFLTRIVQESFHEPLTFAELTALFPPPARKLWSARRKTYTAPQHGDKYRGGYGAPQGQRNDSLMRVVCGMIKRGCDWAYIRDEAYKHGMACTPPLPETEIGSVLKSCRRYA